MNVFKTVSSPQCSSVTVAPLTFGEWGKRWKIIFKEAWVIENEELLDILSLGIILPFKI